MQIFIEVLARILCITEVQEDPKPEVKPEDIDAVVPLKKQRKERKRLKAAELKYNKFQPPPPAQQAMYNTQAGNFVGPGGAQAFPMPELHSQSQPDPAAYYGSMPRRTGQPIPNHTTQNQTYYVQPQSSQRVDQTMEPDPSAIAQNQVIESDVREIKRILRTYIQRLNEKDAQGRVAKEWRTVAKVIDRVFFFAFLAAIFVSLATIFPKGE